MRQTVTRSQTDLFRIMVTNVAAISFFNFSPLILGALIDERSFTYQQVGWLAGIFMLGLASVNTIWGIAQPRLPRHIVARSGAALASLCFVLAIPVHNFSIFAIVLAGAGIGCGLCFGLTITSLGEDAMPESKFGFMQALQTLTAALGLFILPWSTGLPIGIAGSGLLLCAALMTAALASAGALTSNSSSLEPVNTKALTPRPTWPFWVACAILLLNVAAEASVWSFLERIALARYITTQMASQILAASFFAAGLGSLAGGFVGTKYGRTAPFLLAVGASILAVFMFWQASGLINYIIAVMLFAGAWNFGACYRMGLAIAADETGARAPLIPAAQTIGAAIGPALGGSLIINDNFSDLYLMAIGLWLVTIALFYMVHARLKS